MSKTFKRNILVIIFIVISTLLTSCGPDNSKGSSTPQALEYQLVSCYIEFRNVTNQFGGILYTDKYFHYGFLSGDQVIFDELKMYDSYGGITYKLKFEITDENPKVIKQKSSYQNVFTFQLTQEMYDKLFIPN